MKTIKKNIFKFIIAIIFALPLSNNASAGLSCVKNSLSIQQIITSLLPSGIILDSAASTYMQHFDMTSAEGSSCRVPSTQVKYNVNQAFIFNSLLSISDVNNPMTSYKNSGAEYFLIYPGTKIEVLSLLTNPAKLSGSFMKLSRIETADKVCLQAIPPGLGFLTSWIINLEFPLGCKYKPDPSNKQTFKEFTKKAKAEEQNIVSIGTCLDTNASENTFSLSAFYPIVNCINQATDMLFFNKLFPEKTISHVILQIFKPFIIAMLTISVIIFGMKLALGAVVKKQDIFIFVIKIVVVISFTLGKNFPNIPPYDNGISSPNGIQFVQKFFKSLTNGLTLIGSTLDISKTNNHHLEEKGYVSDKSMWSTLCNLGQGKNSPSNSPPALIIFKEVDCRISYYLGTNLSNAYDTVKSASASTSTPSKSFFNASDNSILNIPALALFSFSILFCLMSLLFVLLIISVFVSVVHVYCIAMIIQSILIIFAPLMIPCVLFQYTKGYYDSWIRLLLSFSLQPMIYILALSLMFATFDVIAVGDCQYEANNVNITIPVINDQNNSTTTNTITTIKELKLLNHPKSKTCKLSLLYRLQQLQKTNNIFYIGNFTSFLQPKMLSNQFFTQMLFPLLAIILCGLIFYVMLEALDDLAATLSGGPPLGQLAISPTKLIKSLFNGAKSLYDASKKDKKPDEDAEVNENDNNQGGNAQVLPRGAGNNAPGGGGGGGGTGGSGATAAAVGGSGATAAAVGSGAAAAAGGSGAAAAAGAGSGAAGAAGGSGAGAAGGVTGAAKKLAPAAGGMAASRQEDAAKESKTARDAGGLAAASSGSNTDNAESSGSPQTRARAPIANRPSSTPKSDE